MINRNIKKDNPMFEFWKNVYALWKDIPETNEEWEVFVNKCSELDKMHNSNSMVHKIILAMMDDVEKTAKEIENGDKK